MGRRPLKKILLATQEQWDDEAVRPDVRAAFRKVVDCGSIALGAEVYASPNGERRVVNHTCKSQACPSCGHRANLQWQRERWADLPDLPYTHVVLTMPDVLWPIFMGNRYLLNDLPAIGAFVLQRWIRLKHKATTMVMVILHTFGRDLKFNPHLHLLVSGGGLNADWSAWLPELQLDMERIMPMWRYMIVTYLRIAYGLGLLSTSLDRLALMRLLDGQYRRRWHVYQRPMANKGQIIRYAGRYVRRPPIAEHRIIEVTEKEVSFKVKDLKTRQTIICRYSAPEFVQRLSHHVPDRYRHNVRYFGLVAPRTKAKLYDFVFHLVHQHRKTSPRRLSWAQSIRSSFGVDPLIDCQGQRMRWAGRLPARSSPTSA